MRTPSAAMIALEAAAIACFESSVRQNNSDPLNPRVKEDWMDLTPIARVVWRQRTLAIISE